MLVGGKEACARCIFLSRALLDGRRLSNKPLSSLPVQRRCRSCRSCRGPRWPRHAIPSKSTCADPTCRSDPARTERPPRSGAQQLWHTDATSPQSICIGLRRASAACHTEHRRAGLAEGVTRHVHPSATPANGGLRLRLTRPTWLRMSYELQNDASNRLRRYSRSWRGCPREPTRHMGNPRMQSKSIRPRQLFNWLSQLRCALAHRSAGWTLCFHRPGRVRDRSAAPLCPIAQAAESAQHQGRERRILNWTSTRSPITNGAAAGQPTTPPPTHSESRKP